MTPRSPGWQAFDQPDKEGYFLRELRWEIENNPDHPLFEKEARILGWVPGYDDFLLYLSDEGTYAYVHLTWAREVGPSFPYCVFFDDLMGVRDFLGHWADSE